MLRLSVFCERLFTASAGMVANNPARQLKREKIFFSCPGSRPRILVSRDRFGRSVPRQPAHLMLTLSHGFHSSFLPNTTIYVLARPNSQARTGTGEYYFPCSADHEQDWQPYPVDPYSAICDDHTYILSGSWW